MSFYSLSKFERIELVAEIHNKLEIDIKTGDFDNLYLLFADNDTYIRKAAYTETGKIFFLKKELRDKIVDLLTDLLKDEDYKIRQTAINSAGEIGKTHFEQVEHIFDMGLFDKHHAPRNAVIGSIKKMGEKNALPILEWSKKYLKHPNKEIRREICHGLELRGRTHPEDVLPLLREFEFDNTKRVRSTLIHVIGQIAYKNGCLAKVVNILKTWENKKLVAECWIEIIMIHDRYKNFSFLTAKEAKTYIETECGILLA